MIYFLYDSDGYYIGNDSIQSGNCTDIEPTLAEGYWSRFDGTHWNNEKIPDSATELEGIVLVSDESLASNHDKEVYSLFQKYLDDTHYIEEDSENKTMTFKAYTEEEIAEQEELEQEQIKQKENEIALADLKDRMATADLLGDEEWKEELRAEYLELMEEM